MEKSDIDKSWFKKPSIRKNATIRVETFSNTAMINRKASVAQTCGTLLGYFQLTLSATPPGKIVLTTTPVLLPPIIPKAKPDPSLIKSITSTCAHSVFN